MKQRITRQPAEPRITTIGTRIHLIHYAYNDVGLVLDGELQRCYGSVAEAEHAGAMRLQEEMNDMERRQRAA